MPYDTTIYDINVTTIITNAANTVENHWYKAFSITCLTPETLQNVAKPQKIMTDI